MHKVLIIEDDAALRTAIAQTVELADMTPIPTGGFVQARRTIRANFAGVILSDIRMPDHSGFEVLEFVQAKDPELPVILLTGHSDVPTAMRAMKAGAYDYLEKPFEPARLVDALTRALDHRRVVMDNRALKVELESRAGADTRTLAERLEDHEKAILEQALAQADGKVAVAADRLGLARNTMYDRMAKFQIVAKAFRGG